MKRKNNVIDENEIEENESKIDFDIKSLDVIWHMPKETKVAINITKVADLNVKKVNEIQKYMNLTQINIKDKTSNYVDSYDVETYKKIRLELDKIVSKASDKTSDIDKFLEIYKTLGQKISYNYNEVRSIDKNGYIDVNKLNHSLEGGLLNNYSVCEGYSKILNEALTLAGIQSKYIKGQTSTKQKDNIKVKINEKIYNSPVDLHVWNQVNIGGKWYNTDLTYDAVNIKDGRELDYCLQSDKEFINHYPTSRYVEKCDKSYNREEISKKLGIAKPFKIENKEYTTSEMIELISKLNESAPHGTIINIIEEESKRENENNENSSYELMIGNINYNSKIKWPSTLIKISEKQIAELAQSYAEKFHVTEKKGILVKSAENVEFVDFDNIDKIINEQGLNTKKMFRPQRNKKIAENALVEYKTSIWLKIKNSIKNTIEKLQKSFSKNKMEDNSTNLKENIEENCSDNKLRTWDLKNWSNEEIQFYKEQAKADKNKEKNTQEKDIENI